MEEDFTTLLDTAVAVPVFWRQAPASQTTRPYISLTLVSHPTSYSLDSEVREALIQVDVWASKVSEASAVAKQVHTALSGYSGTQGATRFKAIFSEAERDTYGDLPDGRVFGRSMDFRVHYG